jgi:hypothetical protein
MEKFRIQNEINKRIKKASQFYELVKRLLGNKHINKKCKCNIFKIYFKRILLHGGIQNNKKRG